MKLWQKSVTLDKQVEDFTVGADRVMDMLLARADVIGSLAHTRMLHSIGLLSAQELNEVQVGLKQIYGEILDGKFKIDNDVEDIHSQVEFNLTEMVGSAGKKIHSGRSRNDQVLVDLKIFLRGEIAQILELSRELFDTLISLSERHKSVLMPGYTHLQVAMPSSFGLWFGAYAESLVDDMEMLLAAYKVCNKNPLGSAAGYGSSFPHDRELTTELLGFDKHNFKVNYAQMGRGKCEKILPMALSSIASTISRLAGDNCLYSSQNFGFVSYPDSFTTGSSIMPHKKNPDVWELTRGKCNLLQSLPTTISMLTTNLPLGYNRDLQLLKESLFPAIETLKEVLSMVINMIKQVKVNNTLIEDSRYDYIFSVESVNALVLEGAPFREAYRRVSADIERGEFTPMKDVLHTHEGSIGQLCNDKIVEMFKSIEQQFNIAKFKMAEQKLVQQD